jgi:hypothetical protein
MYKEENNELGTTFMPSGFMMLILDVIQGVELDVAGNVGNIFFI